MLPLTLTLGHSLSWCTLGLLCRPLWCPGLREPPGDPQHSPPSPPQMGQGRPAEPSTVPGAAPTDSRMVRDVRSLCCWTQSDLTRGIEDHMPPPQGKPDLDAQGSSARPWKRSVLKAWYTADAQPTVPTCSSVNRTSRLSCLTTDSADRRWFLAPRQGGIQARTAYSWGIFGQRRGLPIWVWKLVGLPAGPGRWGVLAEA